MGIGSHLLSDDNLALVARSSWREGRRQIVELGRRYYDEHPSEARRVADNLAHLGLASDDRALDAALDGVVVHYFEKLFALVSVYDGYRVAKRRIDVGLSLKPLLEAQRRGQGVFIGQSHFGATYLLGVTLMLHGFDPHMVASFPGPVGAKLVRNARLIASRYNTGQLSLLNLADPKVDVPGEMLRLLVKRQMVSNVFDEMNEFCKDVKLLGRALKGGTGMDMILRNFDDEKIVVVTPFLIRTSDETFELEIDQHLLKDGDVIDSFYRSLEKRVKKYPDQWYFIHEVHENFVVE
jgi:lauroyl/myristoyl acyltransferase